MSYLELLNLQTDCDLLATIKELALWLEKVCHEGPTNGYFPEPSKSILIVKEEFHATAKELFQHQGLTIVSGHRYLGGFVGDQTELAKYVRSRVIKWSSQINAVTQAAASFPHEAFSAISRSNQSKWSFLTRVVPDAGQFLGDLEEAVRNNFS